MPSACGGRRPTPGGPRLPGCCAARSLPDRGADVPAMIAEQLIALAIDETSARPVVLVIDDLQWADRASVKLWGRLARTARQVPLLLVGLTWLVAQREELRALRRGVDNDARVQLYRSRPASRHWSLSGSSRAVNRTPGCFVSQRAPQATRST